MFYSNNNRGIQHEQKQLWHFRRRVVSSRLATSFLWATSCRRRSAARVCPCRRRGGQFSQAKGTGGARAYLAVSGGLDVPQYLGSRSTFPGGNLGGVQVPVRSLNL